MLEKYSKEWPDKYAAERDLLSSHLGNASLDIQHIGSTAVPGLTSKPIIDTMIAIPSIGEAGSLVPVLENIGYVHKPEMSSTERLFFRKGDPVEYHLSLTQPDHTSYWERQILFRDYLIAHPEYAREYESIKQEALNELQEVDLADLSRSKAYSEKKGPFIQKVLELARADKS
jgi:GrpB-like predicted nucleotidyltransferase (UPF0157 family)